MTHEHVCFSSQTVHGTRTLPGTESLSPTQLVQYTVRMIAKGHAGVQTTVTTGPMSYHGQCAT